ncbi:MAG: helix-turn-helix transcriptional regulator [Defluviitaleaceae bacterium]|nr:helix-turn-helix transcriptional regulator [Defluviitaleaceae bacterium]
MNNDSNLSIGKKIKNIRTAKGISQENMARAIKSSQSYIHRIEQGQAECSADMLAAIRKFLEIEKTPLLKDELSIYRHRIWAWDSLLNNNRLAEANDIQAELSSILDLPFERDLYLLFTMMQAKQLIKERNVYGAEAVMNEIDVIEDSPSKEALYMYHRNKGTIYTFRGEKKKGLKHQLLAHDLANNDIITDGAMLSAEIGVQYLGLGRPYQAMMHLERAYSESYGGSAHFMRSHISTMLAATYMSLGEYRKARELFYASLEQAKSVSNSVQLGYALLNTGLYEIKSGNYEEGIEICNQALAHYQSANQEDKFYVTNKGFSNNPHVKIVLFNKSLGLLKLKEFAQCQEVLAQGKALADDDGDEKAGMMFETLRCFATLSDSESEKYIENTAIPFFRAGDGFDKLMILDLCKDLEAHYKKKRAKTKALAIAAIARDIYEEMFIGEIDI